MITISRECKLDKKLSELEIYRAKKTIMQNKIDDIYIIANTEVSESNLKIDFAIIRYTDKHEEKAKENQILMHYLGKYIDYKFELLKFISRLSEELNRRDEIYESTDFDAIDFNIFFD